MQKPKMRDSNMKHMEALQLQVEEHGLAVVSYEQNITNGTWKVKYFNRKSKLLEPKVEECRDRLDYDLRWAAWFKLSTIESRSYPSFMEMVDGEIKRLRTLP